MADRRHQRRRGRRGRAGGRRALLAALLLLGGVSAAASLALAADRLGWRGGRARPRGARGGEARVVARQGRAEGEGAARPPTADIFGVQEEACVYYLEPGDARDPREFGETGQMAEAIETGVRGQGGGLRLRERNAIIFPSESSREGGVYVEDFNRKGPDGNRKSVFSAIFKFRLEDHLPRLRAVLIKEVGVPREVKNSISTLILLNSEKRVFLNFTRNIFYVMLLLLWSIPVQVVIGKLKHGHGGSAWLFAGGRKGLLSERHQDLRRFSTLLGDLVVSGTAPVTNATALSAEQGSDCGETVGCTEVPLSESEEDVISPRKAQKRRSSGDKSAGWTPAPLEAEELDASETGVELITDREGATVRGLLDDSVACIQVDNDLEVSQSLLSSPVMLYGSRLCIDANRRIVVDVLAEVLRRCSAVRRGPHVAAVSVRYDALGQMLPPMRYESASHEYKQKNQQYGQNQPRMQNQLVLLPMTAKPPDPMSGEHQKGRFDFSGPEETCFLLSLADARALCWKEDVPKATFQSSAFASKIELAPPRELWHEARSVARGSSKAFDLIRWAVDGRGERAACFLTFVSSTDKHFPKDIGKTGDRFWRTLDLMKRLATKPEFMWSSGKYVEQWRFVFFGDRVPPRVSWHASWSDSRGFWFEGTRPPNGCSSSTATTERNSWECGPPAILCIDDRDAIQPQGSAWSVTGATGSSSGEDPNVKSAQNGSPESGDGTGSSRGKDRNVNSAQKGLPESGNGRDGDESDKAAGEKQRKRLKQARQKQKQRARLREDPEKWAAYLEKDRERKRDAALRRVADEVIDNVYSRKRAREKPPDRASPQSHDEVVHHPHGSVSPQSHDQVVHHPHGSHLQEEVVSSEQELEQPCEIAQPRRLDSLSLQTPEQRKIADLNMENEQLRQENKHLRQENNHVRQENTDLRKDNEQKGLTLFTLFHALADAMKGPDLWKTICPLFNREELPGPSRASSNPRFSGAVGGSRYPCTQYSTPAKYPDPSPRTPDTSSSAFESGAVSAGALSAGGHNPAACRSNNLGYACLGPEHFSCHFQDKIQGAALNLSGSMATPRATHSQARPPQCEAHDHCAGRPSAAPLLDLGFGETADGSWQTLPQDCTPTPHQLAAPMITPKSQMAGDAIAAPLSTSTPEIIPSPAPVEAFWRQSWSEPLRGPQDLERPPGDYDDDEDDDDYGDVDEIFRFP